MANEALGQGVYRKKMLEKNFSKEGNFNGVCIKRLSYWVKKIRLSIFPTDFIKSDSTDLRILTGKN